MAGASRLARLGVPATTPRDMRPAVAEVTRMFFESPSPAEARAWGTSAAEAEWRDGAVAVRRRLASAIRAILRRTAGIR
jgi:hypothetical protein